MQTIPKIIHYCWFGNPEKPKKVKKFIENWHKMLPDYTFMEWNESNCNLQQEIDYVKEAYQCKKYAFVSDYIRVKKLYEYGGVYLDTDVKILKRFDRLLQDQEVVLGFQGTGNLLTAFIATIPQHFLFEEFLRQYATRHFLNQDGSMDLTSINRNLDPLVEKRGLNLSNDSLQRLSDNIIVYPTEYFCAFDIENWHPIITEQTYTVHYMASSWCGWRVKLKIMFCNLLYKLLGQERYDRLRKRLRKKHREL